MAAALVASLYIFVSALVLGFVVELFLLATSFGVSLVHILDAVFS